MISQRDAVGLVTFDTETRTMIPPRSAPGHFSTLCKAMEETPVGGETPLSGVLHGLAERIKRRGLVIVLSDGFDRADEVVNALRHLRHRRHEVLFFQTVAPEEESFPFNRPSKFRDLERPARDLRVNPAALRATYLERFEAHRQALRDGLLGMNADYHKVSTAEPHAQTLLDYLTARSARGRTRGAGMSWGVLNIAMLAGLAGVALPVVIHLLSRRRDPVVDWGAMQFLELGPRSRRRINLADQLLMLARMALIGLVALAMARPFLAPNPARATSGCWAEGRPSDATSC